MSWYLWEVIVFLCLLPTLFLSELSSLVVKCRCLTLHQEQCTQSNNWMRQRRIHGSVNYDEIKLIRSWCIVVGARNMLPHSNHSSASVQGLWVNYYCRWQTHGCHSAEKCWECACCIHSHLVQVISVLEQIFVVYQSSGQLMAGISDSVPVPIPTWNHKKAWTSITGMQHTQIISTLLLFSDVKLSKWLHFIQTLDASM